MKMGKHRLQRMSDITSHHGAGSSSGHEIVDIDNRVSSPTSNSECSLSEPEVDIDLCVQPYLSNSETPQDSSAILEDHRVCMDSSVDRHSSPRKCAVYFDVVSVFDRCKAYEPVLFHPQLPCCFVYSQDNHANRLGSQLNIPAWEFELGFENDCTRVYSFRYYQRFPYCG